MVKYESGPDIYYVVVTIKLFNRKETNEYKGEES